MTSAFLEMPIVCRVGISHPSTPQSHRVRTNERSIRVPLPEQGALPLRVFACFGGRGSTRVCKHCSLIGHQTLEVVAQVGIKPFEVELRAVSVPADAKT